MDLPQIIVPKRYIDDRGWFRETFHVQRLKHNGITSSFVQDNQSVSHRAGTLRGLHFQAPPFAQAKLVHVPFGRVFDVVVDIRRGSPTYAQHVSVELSADNGRQLYIPVGFAHGFLTLEDKVMVEYKVSNYFSPTHDHGIRWNDPQLAIAWPTSQAAIITSEKDRQLPFLSDFVSPFSYAGQPLAPLEMTDHG